MTATATAHEDVKTPSWLTPLVKLLISAALIFHLVAVFLPPLAVVPSPATGPMADALSLYTGPLRLNNGYRFFSPDPPNVSVVVQYEIELSDGETLKGIFPNKQDYWPRLFYHRHLMLTSRLQSLGYDSMQIGWGNEKPLLNDGSLGGWIMTQRVSAGDVGDVDQLTDSDYRVDESQIPEALRLEPPDRLDARKYVRSYAEHLRAKYHAKRVQLFLVEHGVPPRDMFITEGVTLDTPRSYRKSLLIDLPGETP